MSVDYVHVMSKQNPQYMKSNVLIKDGELEWITLKVFRTITVPKKIGETPEGDVYQDKVHKVSCYNEHFIAGGITKIEPNIYSKNKPPAKNSCVIFYSPTNQYYKVKGSKKEILNKLNEQIEGSKKIGFIYNKRK